MKPPERAAGFCCLGWFKRIGIFARKTLKQLKKINTMLEREQFATNGTAPGKAPKKDIEQR